MESGEIGRRAHELDELRHETEDGTEFWYARELMGILGYAQWRRFEDAMRRAMTSAKTNGIPVEYHFAEVGKMVELGSGAQRIVRDYMLTRYACYLVAMNGDPRKQEIAFAQSYFALQTRNHELIAQRMNELQRLQSRDALSETEKLFSAVAFERDVDGRGIARIKAFGDKALFVGHDTAAMKRRLGITSKSKPLADALPDVTLAAKNLAMSLTTHNVEERDLRGERAIGVEHVENNATVRGRSSRARSTRRSCRPQRTPRGWPAG